MKDFGGKLGVVTGAGTGIGRALACQLAAEGCELALCDIHETNLAQTVELCQHMSSPPRISAYRCDVADEAQVQGFLDHVQSAHASEHINLLINNAGISGGGSFIESSRAEWERTFDICWRGVYLMTRAFLPMLLKSDEGHLVNMSSANALRAVLGGQLPHTAYSAAKFAVRGFSEALIHDFRFNAPHLKVSVVMPGAVGTEILSNSAEVLGRPSPAEWTSEDIAAAKRRWTRSGDDDAAHLSDAEVRSRGQQEVETLRQIGLSAEEAARQILDGVRQNRWRILLGTDTESLDELVRSDPEGAYDPDFVLRWREANARLQKR